MPSINEVEGEITAKDQRFEENTTAVQYRRNIRKPEKHARTSRQRCLLEMGDDSLTNAALHSSNRNTPKILPNDVSFLIIIFNIESVALFFTYFIVYIFHSSLSNMKFKT